MTADPGSYFSEMGILPSFEEVDGIYLDYEITRELIAEPFTSLQGLAQFQRLEELSVTKHQVRDLKGLGEKPLLKKLILSNNEVSSLAGIESCPLLEYLDVSMNQLEGLSEITPLIHLKELYAGHNLLRSAGDLQGMHQLHTISLSGNRNLHTVEGLENLPALECLYLRNCRISDWEKLSGLKHLHFFSGSVFTGAELNILPHLPALRQLDLRLTGFTGDLRLPAIPSLVSLTLSGAAASPTFILEAMPALSELRITKSAVTHLKGMDQLPALKEIWLSETKLEDLRDLMTIQSLEKLHLGNNPLSHDKLKEFEAASPKVEILYD